jgi:hypothetical protein
MEDSEEQVELRVHGGLIFHLNGDHCLSHEQSMCASTGIHRHSQGNHASFGGVVSSSAWPTQ